MMADFPGSSFRSRTACVLSLGITLCLCSYKSVGVDPTENLSELHHTQWTAQDGAPTEVVALAQTNDGYLWLASSNGLFRFDGLSFEPYTASVDGYSVEGDISALWVAPSGALWIGMRFGGIFRLQDGHVTHYGPSQGLPMRAVRQIVSQEDGTIWTQTQGGLYRQEGDQWRLVGADWHYSPDVGQAAIVDGNGTLWSRGVSGTYYLLRGSHSFEKSTLPGGVGRMGLSRDGRAWVSDRLAGLVPPHGNIGCANGPGLRGQGHRERNRRFSVRSRGWALDHQPGGCGGAAYAYRHSAGFKRSLFGYCERRASTTLPTSQQQVLLCHL